jgi:HEAT repeat protein
MYIAEINRCIEILHEKPRLFFQREDIGNKLQCLDTIQKIGTPGNIYSLIEFLKGNNVLIQSKAAETILSLFGKLGSLNEYTVALKHLPIKTSDLDYYRIDFDERTYAHLLGIASLNRNGYVREKAVQELARLKNTIGLKFILFRLGDWVVAVRKAATEAVLSFLDDAFICDLLKQLPTIEWLLKVERVSLIEVHNRIIEFILSQEFSNEFYNKINRLNDKARFLYYKIFLGNKIPTNEQVNKISHDKNFLVRLELVKRLPAFDTDVQKELITSFLKDPSARIRLEALYAGKRFYTESGEQVIALLCDEAASVRELCRRLLKYKGLDFAAFYRQRIAARLFLSGSLPGLSETGNSEDLPIFEHYINSRKSNLIVACLTAINKFNEEKSKQYALVLLVNEIKRVRDKAVEILSRGIDLPTLEKVRYIYANGEYKVKIAILKLYSKVGGWNIIGDLLIALTDENINIQELSWQLLDKWKLKATRLFTTPSKAEVERANRIYSMMVSGNFKMTQVRSNLLEDLRFFLQK